LPTDDDIKKLIHVAKKKPRDLALLLVLLDTGIRASECCCVTLEDVIPDNRYLWIRNGKGGKSRYIFFSDMTVRSLKRLNPHDKGLVGEAGFEPPHAPRGDGALAPVVSLSLQDQTSVIFPACPD